MGLTTSQQVIALNKAKAIREDLYSRIERAKLNYQAPLSEISTEVKKKIRQSDASSLADMLDAGEATSLEIMYIFIEQTMTVGVSNNYVLDQMFDEAIEVAKMCDQQRQKDGYKKRCWRVGKIQKQCYPPFYGVPTSIKETMIVKGRQTHVGFVSTLNPITDRDGHFAMMIRKMGFIPFVRTNVPQGCKTIQTNNNMFGYSKNPWNKQRSCGGSSGGESGMVASYCAPIGFGSDIGGSLRIPASFTGLTSLKPSYRYSRLGNCYYGKHTGGVPTKAEMGPIARTTRDLVLCHNYLYDQQNYEDIPLEYRDPIVAYKPMDTSILSGHKKMKVGYSMRLRNSRCSKPVERAMRQTILCLKLLGHELVDVGNLGDFQNLYFIFVLLIIADGKLNLFKEMQHGEPLTKEYKLFALMSKIPWIIRKIVAWLIKKKQPRLSKMILNSKPLSVIEVYENIYKADSIGRQVYQIFAKNKLDAILMPTFVTPAPLLGKAGELQYCFSYCMSWNIMHYPAGVLPVTVCKNDELDFEDEFRDFYTKNIQKCMKQSAGLPVAVQIVSTPFNEEKILALMQQIEAKVEFNSNHHIPE